MAALHVQDLERPRGADDVHDGVQRPDLVEMDLLEGGAVHLGLAAAQELEGGERAPEHARGKPSPFQHAADLGVVAVGLGFLGAHVEKERIEAVALHEGRGECESLERKGAKVPLDLGQRSAQRDQRTQDHVAARAADAVEVDDAHVSLPGRERSAMTPAAYPAPNPLSMFTTVTPAAQELSIARRAARPPKEAP